MRTLMILLLVSSFYSGKAQFEIDSIASGKCLRQAAALKDKQTQRTEDYRKDLEEYKKGLFCSDCKDSKRYIEEVRRINFTEHINAVAGRKEERATKEMYEELYKKYKNDYDNLEEKYWDKRKECDATVNNERTTEENFFNVAYNNATQTLNEIKRNNPNSAANYENTYGSRLRQILSQFQAESSKGSKASVNNLRQYKKSLDAVIDNMSSVATNKSNNNQNNSTTSNNNSNNSKPLTISPGNNSNSSVVKIDNQKQQYQNDADNYLKKSQDNTQSVISRQMNLDLAKTSAMMAGNTQQLREIENLQNQQRQQQKEQVVQNLVTDIANIISTAGNNKYTDVVYGPYTSENELKIMSSAEAIGLLNETFKLNPRITPSNKSGYWVKMIDSIYMEGRVLEIVAHHSIYNRKNQEEKWTSSIWEINIDELAVSMRRVKWGTYMEIYHALNSSSPNGCKESLTDYQKKRKVTKTISYSSFNFEDHLSKTDKSLVKKCADAFLVLISNYKQGN